MEQPSERQLAIIAMQEQLLQTQGARVWRPVSQWCHLEMELHRNLGVLAPMFHEHVAAMVLKLMRLSVLTGKDVMAKVEQVKQVKTL